MKTAFLTALLLLVALPCYAEPDSELLVGSTVPFVPQEQVTELSRQGQHYEALKTLWQQPQEMSLSARNSAAQSAWALGLVDIARGLWEEIFAAREFSGVERARSMLARSILEFQEQRYEQSRSYAERATQGLGKSELRGQLWLVIAEALKAQEAYSLAESYYQKALDETEHPRKNEARFLLGECQLKLGKVNDARYTYVGVETTSPFTAQALRRLAEIDYSQRNYEGVLTWVEEGRETYPTEFNDGWVTYALVSALLEFDRKEEAEKELGRFRVQHGDSNTWYSLALSAYEAKAVSRHVAALEKGH